MGNHSLCVQHPQLLGDPLLPHGDCTGRQGKLSPNNRHTTQIDCNHSRTERFTPILAMQFINIQSVIYHHTVW